MKTVYFNVQSPSQYRVIHKNTFKFRFASPKIFPGKKFDFQVLLVSLKRHQRGGGGVRKRFISKLFPVSVPNYPHTKKTSKFLFASKKNFLAKK